MSNTILTNSADFNYLECVQKGATLLQSRQCLPAELINQAVGPVPTLKVASSDNNPDFAEESLLNKEDYNIALENRSNKVKIFYENVLAATNGGFPGKF